MFGWFAKKHQKNAADAWAAVAAFAVSLAVYVPMLPTAVTFEDSAEFVTATATLGILHPSGYPLYILLAKPFTWLPFATVPWRVALFSAVCAAAAIGLGVSVALRWARQLKLTVDWPMRLTAVGALLVLAFSDIWWSQAIYAKNYALHALLFVGIAYCFVRSLDERRNRWGYLIGLLSGLAAANHLYLTAATAPWIVVAWFWAHRDWRRPDRRWLGVVLAGLVGLLPYVYLFLRSQVPAVYSTSGLITSVADFSAFVSRSHYGDMGGGGNGLLKLALLATLSIGAVTSVGLLAAAAIGGVWWAWRQRRADVVPMSLILAGGMAVLPTVVLLRASAYDESVIYLSRVWFLTFQASIAVVAAVAAIALAGWLNRRFGDTSAFLVVAAFGFAAVASGFVNFPYARAFTDTTAAARLRSGLLNLPPNAVLVVRDDNQVNDTELFTLAHLQLVERRRLDVIVVHDTRINVFYHPQLTPEYLTATLNESRRQLLQATVDWPLLAGRPVYSTFPAEVDEQCVKKSDGSCYRSLSDGRFYEVRPPTTRTPLPYFPVPPDDRNGGYSFALDQILTHDWYAYAAWLYDFGQREEAIAAAATADSYDHSLTKAEQEAWRRFVESRK
ncbi:MAG: DUF2723 domain-containing protein [Patescibacteria group bacterium]|nr:DUF2723 domain-containing protein [Patescibacteria group bacterium]